MQTRTMCEKAGVNGFAEGLSHVVRVFVHLVRLLPITKAVMKRDNTVIS